MTNATSFGKQASTYAKGRPGYPPSLYQWIAENSPNHNSVWDVGTGSGQAARDLTGYFDGVHATDLSAEQIEAAARHPKITYLATPAETSKLPNASVDAVTVATAVHWFATDRFWSEVLRVTKSNALFAAWAYQLPRSQSVVQTEFLDPVFALIDRYWASGNRICMTGYNAQTLNCPFQTVATPNFDAGGIWSGQQLVDFAETWSAHYKARQDGLQERLDLLSSAFLDKYRNEEFPMSLPITLLAARMPK